MRAPADPTTAPNTPPGVIRRVAADAHPGGPNGQGLVLIAGFAGYTAMFTLALTLSFVACSIAF